MVVPGEAEVATLEVTVGTDTLLEGVILVVLETGIMVESLIMLRRLLAQIHRMQATGPVTAPAMASVEAATMVTDSPTATQRGLSEARTPSRPKLV